MNHKQKFCYITLGAVIMLIGMGIGSTFFPPPLIAQHNGVFDEIRCKQLIVVDKNDKPVIELYSRWFGENGMTFRDEDGKEAITLAAAVQNNYVRILNGDEKIAVILAGSRMDGFANYVSVHNKAGKAVFEVSASEISGGSTRLWNQAGKLTWHK